jgi:hypothetical protein
MKNADAYDHWINEAIRFAERTGETASLGLFFGPTNETGRALLERSRERAGGPALRGLCSRLGLGSGS